MRLALTFSPLLALLLGSAGAFTTVPHGAFRSALGRATTALRVAPTKSASDKAADLRAQAEKIRMEAAQMDTDLTKSKIEAVERRLNDKKWLSKHQDQEEVLVKQLEDLNNKLQGKAPVAVSFSLPAKGKETPREKPSSEKTSSSTAAEGRTYADVKSTLVDMNEEERLKSNPLEGFGKDDLALFLPVALAIETEMQNATIEEQLVKFREVPSLQEHFQKKIQELLIEPMDDMDKLEELRNDYLKSNSGVEKDSLKRQIDQLEAKGSSPYTVSNSFYRGTKPMSQAELDIRIENLAKLPPLLQGLFMRRNGIMEGLDLELGILMEHYDEQLQILDQVRYVIPMPATDFTEAVQGYEALPKKVKDYFVKSIGLEPGASSEDVVNKLGDGGVFVSTSPMRVLDPSKPLNLPEYNDIEFIERSRYIQELFPSMTAMEQIRPTKEQIDFFVSEIIDSKTYKLRSKPERVYGGYYIRGYNPIQTDDANDVMVAKLNEKLAASEMAGKLQFFFIPDPKALTDEEIDMATDEEAIILVTGWDPAIMYKPNNFLKKVGISAAGLFSIVIFALGTCELNDIAMARIQDAIQADNVEEILHLTSNALPVGLALAATQVAHEVAHRLVAWKDKVGFPTIVPSIQLGLTGTITPFESPPKNMKSLFDFALAGPAAGFVVSFALLIFGLDKTVATDFTDQSLLPALPIVLLRASALGGSMVEFFLGNGALDSLNPELAVLPLHPFAVAGFSGLLINALALLPLGHTDGGRIALSMLGRRGTYLVKSAAALAICIVGVFGFDEARLLIVYLLFVSLAQRELESPVQNEVDNLDEGRALVGILTALVVTLTLLPMP